jgi:hypothetical protein
LNEFWDPLDRGYDFLKGSSGSHKFPKFAISHFNTLA